MTIIDHPRAGTQVNPATQCPPWCDGGPLYHTIDDPVDPAPQFMHRHVLASGLEIVDGLGEPGPMIYVPEIGDLNDGEITADEARQLAADLIAAADVLEAVSA